MNFPTLVEIYLTRTGPAPGVEPYVANFVSMGLAPRPDTLIAPIAKGINFLRDQCVALDWAELCLSMSTIVFIVLLTKAPSKTNKI